MLRRITEGYSGSRIQIGSKTSQGSHIDSPKKKEEIAVQEVSLKALENSPTGSPSSHMGEKDLSILSAPPHLTEVNQEESQSKVEDQKQLKTIETVFKEFLENLETLYEKKHENSSSEHKKSVNESLAGKLNFVTLIYAQGESPGPKKKFGWDPSSTDFVSDLRKRDVTVEDFRLNLVKAMVNHSGLALITLTPKVWMEKDILRKLDTTSRSKFIKTQKDVSTLILALERISDASDFFPKGISLLAKVAEEMGKLYDVKTDHEELFKRFNDVSEKLAPQLPLSVYFDKLNNKDLPVEFFCEHFTDLFCIQEQHGLLADFFTDCTPLFIKVTEKMGKLYEVKADHESLFKQFKRISEKLAPYLFLCDYFKQLINLPQKLINKELPFDFLYEHFTNLLRVEEQQKLPYNSCYLFIQSGFQSAGSDLDRLNKVFQLADYMESGCGQEPYDLKDLIRLLNLYLCSDPRRPSQEWIPVCEKFLRKFEMHKNKKVIDKTVEDAFYKTVEDAFSKFIASAIPNAMLDSSGLAKLLTLLNAMEEEAGKRQAEAKASSENVGKSLCLLKTVHKAIQPILNAKELTPMDIRTLALVYVKFSRKSTSQGSDYDALKEYFRKKLHEKIPMEKFLKELQIVSCSDPFICDHFIELSRPQLDKFHLRDRIEFINNFLLANADDPQALMDILELAVKIQPSESMAEQQEFWKGHLLTEKEVLELRKHKKPPPEGIIVSTTMFRLIDFSENGKFKNIPRLLKLVEPILQFCDPELLGSLCQKPAHIRFFLELFEMRRTIPTSFANKWIKVVFKTFEDGYDPAVLLDLMLCRKTLYEKSEQQPLDFWLPTVEQTLVDSRRYRQGGGGINPRIEAYYEEYLYAILKSFDTKSISIPETKTEQLYSKRLIDQGFFAKSLKEYILNKVDRIDQMIRFDLKARGAKVNVEGFERILAAILATRPTQLEYNTCANELAHYYPKEALKLLQLNLPKPLPKDYNTPMLLKALDTLVKSWPIENWPAKDAEIVLSFLTREDVIASGQQLPVWRKLWTNVLLGILNNPDKEKALNFFKTHGTKSHEGYDFWRNVTFTHKDWELTLESIYSVSGGTQREVGTWSVGKVRATQHEETEGATSPTLRAPEKMTGANKSLKVPVY